MRDPSTLLIAFALPVVLLLLFSYAVSLDVRAVRIGVVQESESASAQSLAAAFAGTRYLDVTFAHDRRAVADQVVSGDSRGRSDEHTSELQSLMRTSSAVFCL